MESTKNVSSTDSYTGIRKIMIVLSPQNAQCISVCDGMQSLSLFTGFTSDVEWFLQLLLFLFLSRLSCIWHWRALRNSISPIYLSAHRYLESFIYLEILKILISIIRDTVRIVISSDKCDDLRFCASRLSIISANRQLGGFRYIT